MSARLHAQLCEVQQHSFATAYLERLSGVPANATRIVDGQEGNIRNSEEDRENPEETPKANVAPDTLNLNEASEARIVDGISETNESVSVSGSYGSQGQQGVQRSNPFSETSSASMPSDISRRDDDDHVLCPSVGVGLGTNGEMEVEGMVESDMLGTLKSIYEGEL